MMWSRYNQLFRSQRFGWFVYNALSNTLIALDEVHGRALERLRADPPGALAAAEPAFLALLRERHILVEPGEEQGLLLAEHGTRLARHDDNTILGLTVCPTLACNFACPYCFESSQHDPLRMSADTQDRLLAFIEGHEDAHRLSVAWYGGEPTLAWDVVRDVTRRVLALGSEYTASLITNGYLLDAAKIAELNDLAVRKVQITLDGTRESHDARRMLHGGRPTYDVILANIDRLVASEYAGRLAIRVNVDHDTAAAFAATWAQLLERFAGARVTVYPGHVELDRGQACHACALAEDEWAAFTLEQYYRHDILPGPGFHPLSRHGGCVANARNGFVVGPAGELYKCWEDVGRPAMRVGDLHAEPPVTDPGLVARYSIGTDPFAADECLACDILPICGGGCPNKRLRALQWGEPGLTYCSPHKHHLTAYLEAYYDAFLSREVCRSVLTPGPVERDERGFRVVSPAAGAATRRS